MRNCFSIIILRFPYLKTDGDMYLRISSQVYNAKEDYDLLANAILKIVGKN